MDFRTLQPLIQPADSRIVLLVLDGLGGLPQNGGGPTELEAAYTPHLDSLAAHGICGLQQPVGPGITPGSGPAHLALFGYEPLTYQVGRGVLSALGIGFDLQPHDIAARGNFCTVDDDGRVTDRRAGRISNEKGAELCDLLRTIELPDVEVFVEPVKEYRFTLILRGNNLNADIADTDPQQTCVPPKQAQARSQPAQRAARLVQDFIDQARERLADRHPANMLLLRGFAAKPDWPTMPDVFGLRAAAIAGYPMYRGLSRLVGMQVLETGSDFAAELATLKQHWADFDFFYVHVKPTDSAGEDGDFARKARLIEEVDTHIPRLLDLQPDVVVVTGDHSTPARLRAHSWHPVPVLLWSENCRPDAVTQFGERACLAGALGPHFPGADLLPLALANALRLTKFGA